MTARDFNRAPTSRVDERDDSERLHPRPTPTRVDERDDNDEKFQT